MLNEIVGGKKAFNKATPISCEFQGNSGPYLDLF